MKRKVVVLGLLGVCALIQAANAGGAATPAAVAEPTPEELAIKANAAADDLLGKGKKSEAIAAYKVVAEKADWPDKQRQYALHLACRTMALDSADAALAYLTRAEGFGLSARSMCHTRMQVQFAVRDWPALLAEAQSAYPHGEASAAYFEMTAQQNLGDKLKAWEAAARALLSGDRPAGSMADTCWRFLDRNSSLITNQEGGMQRWYDTLQRLALNYPDEQPWAGLKARIKSRLGDFVK
jgi:hypothetical protein